jgi:hypothetical protein
MANEPKSCIFCQNTRKMSGEHVWGSWTKEYVARTSNKHNHANVYVPRPGEPDQPQVRIRAGDPMDSKVNVVCESCNTSWLSEIQNRAKPLLLPLFNGESCVLTEGEQVLVSAWIAMATMTGEHLSADKSRIAIPQSDRDWLMNRQTTPKDWRIWIGRYERKNWPTQWVKASFPILDAAHLPDVVSDHDRRPNMQTTAFTIGQLFVFAMSCQFPEITAGWDWRTTPVARTKLVTLWPVTAGTTVQWPPVGMTDAEADAFSGAVIFYFEDLAKRRGYG